MEKISQPCPFCGSRRTVKTGGHVAKNGSDYVTVNCRDCTASVWEWGTDKGKAVEIWNKRVEAKS